MRLVNEVAGTQPVCLYDIDGDRESDFFGLQDAWHQLPAIGGFRQRAALLNTPLARTDSPSLVNDLQDLYIPEWVEFDSLPSIEFFRRETVLYLERVLGEIPVLVEGEFV